MAAPGAWRVRDEAELSRWTGRNAIPGEMIFQLLSRGRYTPEAIAAYVECPVEAVAIVADRRAREIERNHLAYRAARETMERVRAAGTISRYPVRPSWCVREFLRSVCPPDGRR